MPKISLSSFDDERYILDNGITSQEYLMCKIYVKVYF